MTSGGSNVNSARACSCNIVEFSQWHRWVAWIASAVSRGAAWVSLINKRISPRCASKVLCEKGGSMTMRQWPGLIYLSAIGNAGRSGRTKSITITGVRWFFTRYSTTRSQWVMTLRARRKRILLFFVRLIDAAGRLHAIRSCLSSAELYYPLARANYHARTFYAAPVDPFTLSCATISLISSSTLTTLFKRALLILRKWGDCIGLILFLKARF